MVWYILINIRLLKSIILNDIYGEDAERLPMKKLCQVFLERAEIDIDVKKVK